MIKALLTPEGRRAVSLLFLAGGGMAMTLYALWALSLVRAYPKYVFWLGICAHVAILVVLTGFVALHAKRTLKVGREGVEIADREDA